MFVPGCLLLIFGGLLLIPGRSLLFLVGGKVRVSANEDESDAMLHFGCRTMWPSTKYSIAANSPHGERAMTLAATSSPLDRVYVTPNPLGIHAIHIAKNGVSV